MPLNHGWTTSTPTDKPPPSDKPHPKIHVILPTSQQQRACFLFPSSDPYQPQPHLATMPARAATGVATQAPPRAVRSRRQLQAEADDLADDLSRVLRVSQPKAKAAPARRTVSATKAAVTKEKPKAEAKPRTTTARPRAAPPSASSASSTKAGARPVRTSSSTAKPQGKVAAPPPTKSAQRVRPAGSTTASANANNNVTANAGASADVEGKGAPEATTPEEPDLPWMSKSGGMPSRERALAAQNAINTAKRTVMEASVGKYVYGASQDSKSQWTDAQIRDEVSRACAGIAVLRDIFSTEECASQRLVFERGFSMLIASCVAIRMVSTPSRPRCQLAANAPHTS